MVTDWLRVNSFDSYWVYWYVATGITTWRPLTRPSFWVEFQGGQERRDEQTVQGEPLHSFETETDQGFWGLCRICNIIHVWHTHVSSCITLHVFAWGHTMHICSIYDHKWTYMSLTTCHHLWLLFISEGVQFSGFGQWGFLHIHGFRNAFLLWKWSALGQFVTPWSPQLATSLRLMPWVIAAKSMGLFTAKRWCLQDNLRYS